MRARVRTFLQRALLHPGFPFQLGALFAGLVLVGLAMDLRDAPSGFAVEWEMASTTGGVAQVFPAVAGGYTAERVLDVSLPSDGRMHAHRVEFEGPIPTRIRIDPGSGSGHVDIASIRIHGAGRTLHLEGASLVEGVVLLNDLVPEPPEGRVLRMRSVGPDPYFDFPSVMAGAGALLRLLAAMALAALGLALIAWFGWHRRHAAGTAWNSLGAQIRMLLAIVLVCGFAYALMAAGGLACGRMACSARGWGYAVPLFAASVGFLVLGAALFESLGLSRDRPRPVFGALLAGQVALVVYIYLRSLLAGALPALPLTRFELVAIVGFAAVFLWRRGWRQLPPAGERAWLLLRLALLALACLVVADRELPRLAMLSTDPDTHAFFARQIERLGGIYRDQGPWGPDAMNYPAGSASLVFAWASLAFLDVRNALAALPPLLSLVAALAIVEPLARRCDTLRTAGLVLATAIGITVAGLAFPVYEQFSHMEGTGRLLSIGMVALACLLLFRAATTGERTAHPAALALALALVVFCLGTLNPVNVIPAAVLVTAVALVHGPWRGQALWLLGAVPAGLALLAMDPYYLAFLQGTSPPTKLVLESRLGKLDLEDLVGAWSTSVGGGWLPRFNMWARLAPWHAGATFAVPLVAFAAALIAAQAGPDAGLRRGLAVGVLASVGILLAAALLDPFAADARFYLLPQYFPLAVAQYKALALVALAGLLVARMDAPRRPTAVTVMLVVCTCALVAFAVRPSQPMRTEPRQAYCGSMGCVTPSDVEVVSALEAMVADGRIAPVDGELPRVLVPNHPVQAGPETWVFPNGGSRYLALADALPVAFYYYQGDPDYTTRSYLDHVCQGLDRAWLARERIRYVFLPSERTDACPGAFDALADADRVVLASGGSRLIELAPAAPVR